MPAPLTDLYVVSHTHWDREWYHTAERFQQRLVALIDELIDDPPAAGESFLLDGQAVLLDDYLALRPERAAELGTLLQQRRLEAGPWYVLADELIPGGEALVRNLRIGINAVRRFRGTPPSVLYCPDSFGHPAVLPDIAAGFGVRAIVLWRGLGGDRSPAADVVRWRGAGGNSALVYHLPPDGYEFGGTLPVDTADAEARWKHIGGVLGPRSATGSALLLNGADHHARQRQLQPALRALAMATSPVRVHASSLDDAVRAIVDAAEHVPVAEIAGELRDSYGYAWTLQGTFGSRAAQKRRNAIAERLLVRDVEPWVALAEARGNGSARALLDAAWKTLLQAHPHDTLCGTSLDAVASAFDARVAAAGVQGRGVRDDALRALIDHDPDSARTQPSAWDAAMVFRNAAPRRRGGVVNLLLSATLASVAVGPASASRQGIPRRRPRWSVDGVPLQVLSQGERVALTESARAYPQADLVAEAHAVGWVEPMEGFTLVSKRQAGRTRTQVPHPVRCATTWLDNGLLRVEVDAMGVVSVTDHVLGRRIDDVVSLERQREAGDLYTPAPRERMDVGAARRVRLVHRGPLRGELSVDFPAGGKDRGAGGMCTISIQLDAESRAVRMLVRGENRSSNHRLRLRVDTGLAGSTTLADAAFLPVERTPLVVRPAAEAMEHVVPTAPLHRWVARFTAEAGVAIVSDGLAEYESRHDGSVLVTLIRAVGQLSLADLPERPGHAGWPAATPAAQCMGPYGACFALRMLTADSPTVRDEIEQFAEDELVPLTGETLRSNMLSPRTRGGLALDGAGLTFSAAMPAARDGWIVLRCVNQRATAVRGTWRLAAAVLEAARARLDETVLEPLQVVQDAVTFTAAPHEIVTVLVRLR